MRTVLPAVFTLGALAGAAGLASNALTPTQAFRSANRAEQTRAIENAVLAMCFEPGTPADVQAEVRARFNAGGSRYFLGTAWHGGGGTPVTLRYSFPPDGISIDGGNNVLHETLGTQFASLGGEPAWKAMFASVFARWTQITGNTYILVEDDGSNTWPSANGPFHEPGAPRGDVRIVMGDLGTGGTLAANYFPPLGDMVLNSRVNFAQGSPGLLWGRNIIMHEHGHGLGMAHSCPAGGQTGGQTKLMEPFVSLAFDGPQLDDIRGSQSLYGDRFEPGPANLNLHGFQLGQNYVVRDVTLFDVNDIDAFQFQVPGPARVTATVTPLGAVYRNGPQNGDGSCPAGTNVNPQVVNVRLDLFGPGGTPLATANANPIGQPEAFSNVPTAAVGTHTIRVAGVNGIGEMQVYRVDIFVEDLRVLGDLNSDGLVTSTDLGILLGSWGPCPAPPTACGADINGDGIVNSADLAVLLGGWS